MDSQPANPSKSNLMPVALAFLVIVVIIGGYMYLSSAKKTDSPSASQNQEPTTTTSHIYKDGSYSATGNYVSPGGPREIDLTVTINGDKITDSTFVGKATDPTSIRFQGEFGDNYKTLIVGKSIDEVSLTKVSGSSLTPKGFNDALQKIKAQAKS